MTPETAALPNRKKPTESPWWTILSILCLPISLSLMLEISNRFLSPGPDFIAFLATIVQGLLTASVVGALSKPGKAWIEGALAQRGRRWTRQQMWVGLVSVIWVMLLFLLFHLALPPAAHWYDARGEAHLQAGQVSLALVDFRRAVSLSADNADARFHLAYAYEELGDFDHALTEYRIALEKDVTRGPVYNNLARLFIRQEGDYDTATLILRQGLGQVTEDAARAVIHKNLGWAHYEKKLYNEGLEDLQTSLALQEQLQAQHPDAPLIFAETYRLLALVYEELDSKPEAIQAWYDCLAAAQYEDSLESREWAVEARSHLQRLETEEER